MCKSIKDGGARCSFHLAQGVNGAVLTLATAQTGLARREAEQAFEDLRREGARLEAPAREDVDALLSAVEFRARHDLDLSEHQRKSVIARLRAAIGRVLPDAGTVHAWKNIVAEAWARSRRKVVTVFLAGALSFGVGACGSPAADSAPPAPSSASVSAPVNPAGDERIQSAVIAEGNFSGEAVNLFGQDKVDAAYDEMTTYAQTITFDEDLLVKVEGRSAAEFDAPAAYMTPKAAADYRATVERALTGSDSTAESALEGVSFYNVSGDGVAFASSGPLIVNHQINSASVAVDRSTGVERLQLTFSQHGDLRISQNNQASLVPLDKTTSFWLTPAPAGSGRAWLIDGIQNSWKASAPVADTGSY